MKPALYALAILLVSINLALGLPKAVDLVQAQVSASNISGSKVVTSNESGFNVAGITKVNLPPRSNFLPAPNFSAASVIASEAGTDFILFAKDSHKRVPIASTTKIMTALVSLEYFKPNEILTVPANITNIMGSTMGLRAEERITFRGLLYGMLLNSGNDVAYTVAANYPGGTEAFVAAMNIKASELNLSDTHFSNPAGFDSPDHFSSAYDLVKIAGVALENYQFARVVATKDTIVASEDKSSIHQLKNLNKLLETPGVLGIKTGTTPLAKENLVGLVERDGHKILTVVLGSDDRFGETERLIDWVYANFSWE